MSLPDDSRPGDEGGYDAATDHRRKQRRRRAAVGVAGLAALLGAGAYLVTTQVADRNASTRTRDAGALAPMVAPATRAPSGAASAAASGDPAAQPDAIVPNKGAVKRSTSPSPSKTMTVEEQIKAAREAAAEDGYSVKRPVTPAPGVKLASGLVDARDEPRKNGNLHVVSARYDLSGQRELLWAADKGKKVGEITCTQNFKFSNNLKPRVRPNMLMCWRTSAKKSVVTVLIDRGGKPSTVESAEVIESEWAKLD